jgi:hypothetical protein
VADCGGVVWGEGGEVTEFRGEEDTAFIVLQGEIGDGDLQAFQAALQKVIGDPGVHKVGLILGGGGGQLQHAIPIGNIVRQVGINTFVLSDVVCASSCAFIWLAGKKKFAARDAHIGVHAPRNSQTGREGPGSAWVGHI